MNCLQPVPWYTQSSASSRVVRLDNGHKSEKQRMMNEDGKKLTQIGIYVHVCL